MGISVRSGVKPSELMAGSMLMKSSPLFKTTCKPRSPPFIYLHDLSSYLLSPVYDNSSLHHVFKG